MRNYSRHTVKSIINAFEKSVNNPFKMNKKGASLVFNEIKKKWPNLLNKIKNLFFKKSGLRKACIFF